MGARGRKGTGVELRTKTIRINFTWQGEWCRETLPDLDPRKPPHAKQAARVVAEINKAIANGTFVYAEYFPDSPRAGPKPQAKTVRHYGALWLLTKGNKASHTVSNYRCELEAWYRMKDSQGRPLGDMSLKAVQESELLAMIGGHPWPSAKHMNNCLISIRGALRIGCRELKIANPLDGLKNEKVQKKGPDPLDQDEVDLILADMAKRYDPRIHAYFEFAFYTGMRPEEIIALKWSDVDFRRGTVRVERVKTFKGEVRESTKTYHKRNVRLNPQSDHALKVMKTFTFMKRDAHDDPIEIFENPATNKAWHDERGQRDKFWKPSLRRLGIRARRAYSTRSTFATYCLMLGQNPTYIAKQLGHDVQTFFEDYADWINGKRDDGEHEKLVNAAGSNATRLRSAI